MRSGSGIAPDSLKDFYTRLSGRLIVYVEGLDAWDEVSDAARESFADVLRGRVPGIAVRRYEEHLRRLCGGFLRWRSG